MTSESIPESQWKWFGSAAHLCVSQDCRFHLATQVGEYLISTVGEWLPDEGAREIFANIEGIELVGKGDARRADYMKKLGFKEIGCGRKYETMVFRTESGFCTCGCGLPNVDFSELDFMAANSAGEASDNHMELCVKYAKEN